MFDVKGKVAIVTGGSSGIGLEITDQLLKNGVKGVTIVDINEINGKKVLNNFVQRYGENKVMFIKGDVTKKEDFEGFFEKTISTFKNVDIIVNNAGTFGEDAWEKLISVNLNGVVMGTLVAMEKYFPKYKSGMEALVFNVSSAGGLMPLPKSPVYTATKYGIVGFGRSIGSDVHYEKTKTKVITFCPGFTKTPMTTHQTVGTEGHPPQDPKFVAEAAIKIIQEGNNGSVWVVRRNEIYEAEFPKISEMRKN